MKFLCDRCKTRYSIADERVRGKVLKIRCKSCSHVITVREGMTDEDPAAQAAAPAPGAHAPAAHAHSPGAHAPGSADKGSALADAFAQVMQPQRAETEPPPPALEEEWYVSLDGNQQGPFNLQDAQKWVAAKKHDDELYCWSEGFDDWLPVDKVSHFRGLRPKLAPPPPKARPPAPGRAEPRPAPSAETPQPLFAATLAALEAEVEAADAKTARKPGDGRSKAAAAGASGTAAKAGLAKDDKAAKPADARSNGKGAAAAAPTAAASAAIASLSPAGRGAGGRFDLEGGNRDEPEPDLEDDDDDKDEDKDDLEIGEVSRVVRLPDLMAAHQRKMDRQATSRTGQNTAIRTPVPSLGRGTGGVAALAAAAAAPDGSAAALDPNALPTMADALAAEGLHPLPQPAHKHTTLYVFGGLGLVLLAFAVFVVIKISTAGGEDAIATGDVGRFDSLGRRIDDPQRRAAAGKDDASGKTSGRTASTGGTRRAFPTNTLPGTGDTGAANPGKTEIVIGPDGQPLLPLTVDDVLQVSSRMSSGTRRCYERALKDDPFLKVTKITIDLTVEATGVVSNVTLDRPGQDTLNKCLSGAIKRWPFRRSTKQESFRFPLVFEQR